MPITFSCSSCGKGYKVPEQYAGRGTKCQQCGTALTIPHADFTAAPAALAAPAAWAPTAAGPGLAAKAGSGKLLIIGGALLAALFMVVVGGAAAYWLLARSSPAADAMMFLPSDSQMVVAVKLDDVMASDAWKEMQKSMPDFDRGTKEMEKETGLAPADVVHLTIGGRSEGSDEPIVVVQTKKAVTASDLLAKMKDGKFTEVKVGKYTMHEGEKLPYARSSKAFCVVDSKLIVYGRASGLKNVLERNKKPEFSANLQAALKETDLSQPIAFAVSLKDMQKPSRGGPDPFNQGLAMAEGVAGHATLGKNERLSVTVLCKDAKTAADLRKLIDGGIVAAKQFPGLPKDVVSGLDSLKIANDGSKVTVTSDLKVIAGALSATTLLGRRAETTFERVGSELKKP